MRNLLGFGVPSYGLESQDNSAQGFPLGLTKKTVLALKLKGHQNAHGSNREPIHAESNGPFRAYSDGGINPG